MSATDRTDFDMGSARIFLLCVSTLSVVILKAKPSESSDTVEKNFSRITSPNLALKSLGPTVITDSHHDCCSQCLASQSDCEAFAYNISTGQCTLGTRVSHSGSVYASPDVVLYFHDDISCQTTWHYSPRTSGNTTVYLCLSTTPADYQEASRVCQANFGRLFAVKTKDRMKLLQDMLDSYDETNLWVGADDIVEEGVLVWSDGTSVTQEQINELFHVGQPHDELGMEDCTKFVNLPGYMDLVDYLCSVMYRYICEKLT